MTEFEILKKAHRFLRDEDDTRNQSWDEQLASKYYSSLYREFAVCDLKHYKSGNFALRWRTEDEVLSGAGETTCGSPPGLTTLELPFAYEEHGENKSALVKVVLCPRCFGKLMWKRRKEKGKGVKAEEEDLEDREQGGQSVSRTLEDRQKEKDIKVKSEKVDVELNGNAREERHRSKHRDDRRKEEEKRRRSSRSRSPRSHHRQHNSPSGHRRQSERERRH
ncbi:hypothetical protein H0H87_003695 [Tephrocybe sp. NHM501043]|nr:hypothetical protein H0H87_003695 [Tephrocybe sp. NHM501043]